MTAVSGSEDSEYFSFDPAIVPGHIGDSRGLKQNAANMSKRRFRQSELFRERMTPNQVNRIRDIFEATTSESTILSQPPRRIPRQTTTTNSTQARPLDRTVRLSAHKTNSDYLLSPLPVSLLAALPLSGTRKTCSSKQIRSTANLSLNKAVRNPPSSNKSTPSRIPRLVCQTSTTNLKAGYTYGEDSDDEDLHSTHGVPLILPMSKSRTSALEKTFTVSQWLQDIEVPELSRNKEPSHRYLPATASSSPLRIRGKENYSPHHLKIGSAQAASKLPLINARAQELREHHKPNKSTKRIPQVQSTSGSPLSKSTPSTGLLLLPPRRKGQTPGISTLSRTTQATRPSISPVQGPDHSCHKNADSLDDSSQPANLYDNLIVLSPSVTRYRKHRNHGKDSSVSKLQDKSPFFDPELADFIQSLEAHDREEEQQRRGRSVHRS